MAYPIAVPGPFGIWLSTSRADHILCQEQTNRQHQEHIIVHELGHMTADHRSDEEDDDLLSPAGQRVHDGLGDRMGWM